MGPGQQPVQRAQLELGKLLEQNQPGKMHPPSLLVVLGQQLELDALGHKPLRVLLVRWDMELNIQLDLHMLLMSVANDRGLLLIYCLNSQKMTDRGNKASSFRARS